MHLVHTYAIITPVLCQLDVAIVNIISRNSRPRVALWLRVSTHEQTTDNQRRQLAALAEQRGMEVIHEYDVTGVSAWQNGIQGMVSQVIADAPRLRFSAILIASLDRLSRGGIIQTLTTLQRLSSAGVGVVSYREQEIDTTSPHGELLVALFAHFAALESQRISERTRAGMERARAQGKHIGRPKGTRDSVKRRRRC